jgi:hypothetical protein
VGTKMLPDKKAFASFVRAIFKRDFQMITALQFRKEYAIQLEKDQVPPPLEGETGFVLEANGLTVVVWTTYLHSKGIARDQDAGWVLIKVTGTNKVRYFSHPLRRTKNFLKNLLWQACIAKWRIEHRPACPKCGQPMLITFGKGLGSRYWSCIRSSVHREPGFLHWDHKLPEAALKYLAPIRKRRKKYNAKLRAEGKPVGRALLLRVQRRRMRERNNAL